MAYLNHDQIDQLLIAGEMYDVDASCINAASLDIRLGKAIHVESGLGGVIDYRKREKLQTHEYVMDDDGYVIKPGECILAHSMEWCNFANDTSALFRIKSSMGRIFLEHMDAGFVDPGFRGRLTLEFKNMSNFHSILLRPGDRIGQLIFMKGEPVSDEHSYRTTGNYNDAEGVMQIGYKEAA